MECDKEHDFTSMKPADVVPSGTQQVKINYTETQHFIAEKTPDINTYAESLPASYKRVVGVINQESTLSMLLQDYTEIIGVSDGSVKDGEGSAGYILVKESAEERHIRVSLGVNGSPEYMSSY